MIILVLNCGSSSIKYQVMEITTNESKLLAKGQLEKIGLAEGIIKHETIGKEVYKAIRPIPGHSLGINMIISLLINLDYGVLNSLTDLSAVGHRVAHGGEFFKDSAIVTKDVILKIESCFELAPLHNPVNLKGILAINDILPGIPQVATFDTSFHQTMPMVNFLYGIPYKYYENWKVRKYGFHGTSHKFVAKRGCELAGLNFEKSKIITCHIGNGASVTAIKNGESFDTSMGFTPVDGLLMGTRCGSIDPGALLFIADKERMSVNGIQDLINKESGVLGITELSSDMRDIDNAAAEGNEKAILALDIYHSRIQKYVGSYAAAMGGVDLIVFTGGVGENSDVLRSKVCKGLEFMGIKFNEEINKGLRSKDTILNTPDSKVSVAIICTNEEFVIASDTFRLLKKRSE